MVPIGEHTIVETCTDESADFTLSEGEELDITVVNVLGGDCDPPPAELPNTGAGISAANGWQEWLAILLLIAGGIAMLGALAANRRSSAGSGNPNDAAGIESMNGHGRRVYAATITHVKWLHFLAFACLMLQRLLTVAVHSPLQALRISPTNSPAFA